MGRWDYNGFFEPSVPRRAKGGIKAQSKRGGFGESWWAKRWIEVLESFNIGARLNRGRSYARQGQVLSIEIEKGRVTARVQGSRPQPYEIKLQIKTLSSADWKRLIQGLSQRAIYSAKLLAGQMPADIERVFQAEGISLFPKKGNDLKTECSCPDWSNPCKHIAAVYYLLGEEFDRDPFLVFKLRGMSREELVKSLQPQGKKTTGKRGRPKLPSSPKAEEALPPDPDAFWTGRAIADDFFGEVILPPVSAALPRRLGSFPFWRGEEKFLDTMEWIYEKASRLGLDLFVGNSAENFRVKEGLRSEEKIENF
jgi:uncharacterized Zn finger protein